MPRWFFNKAAAAWAFICGAYVLVFYILPFLDKSYSWRDTLIIFISVAFWLFVFCEVTRMIVRNRPTCSLLEFSLILAVTFLISHFLPFIPGPQFIAWGLVSIWDSGELDVTFFALFSWSAIILCAFVYLYIAFIKHYKLLKASHVKRDE
jgi:hypothetical protein